MILRYLGFSTLEYLYFLCFGHSYFISIDMDIPQMKSNFIFCDKIIVTGMKYIKSVFDHFFSYVGLKVFYLINVPGMHQ